MSSYSFLLLCFLACSLVWQESAVNRGEGRREEKEPWAHNRNQHGAYGTERQQCCHVRRPAGKGTQDWMWTPTATVIIMTITVMGHKHVWELTFLMCVRNDNQPHSLRHTRTLHISLYTVKVLWVILQLFLSSITLERYCIQSKQPEL